MEDSDIIRLVILTIAALVAASTVSDAQNTTHRQEPVGASKVARDVSSASKRAGAKAKQAAKDAGSHARGELTKAGKEVEAEAKPKSPR